MKKLGHHWRRRLSELSIVGFLASACGGTQPSASNAEPAPSTTAAAPAKNDSSNSLSALRAKLSAGENLSELNLAAKGFGPELGPLLAESPSLGSADLTQRERQ